MTTNRQVFEQIEREELAHHLSGRHKMDELVESFSMALVLKNGHSNTPEDVILLAEKYAKALLSRQTKRHNQESK